MLIGWRSREISRALGLRSTVPGSNPILTEIMWETCGIRTSQLPISLWGRVIMVIRRVSLIYLAQFFPILLSLIRHGGWKERPDGENLSKIKGVCSGEGLRVSGLSNLSARPRAIRILEETATASILSLQQMLIITSIVFRSLICVGVSVTSPLMITPHWNCA